MTTRMFLLLVMLVMPVAAQAAEGFRCDDTLRENDVEIALTGASIFNGPPLSTNEIFPFEGEWDLEELKDPDKRFFLVCHYGEETDKAMQIPVFIDYCAPDGNNVACR